MTSFLLALVPLLGGLTQPLKDFFASKAKQAELTQQLELAKIEAEKTAIISGNEAEVQKVQSYLSATSRAFRQGTFYFLVLPVIVSILLPSYAEVMWANFEKIPEWFRILFVSVYSVIWGLPVAREHIGGMFKSLGNVMQARREYKVEIAKYNRKAVFDTIRQLFPKGMNQAQVNLINEALDKGEVLDSE